MVVIQSKVAEDSASVYVQICCVQLFVNLGVIVIAIKCEALSKKVVVVIGTESSINF